MAPLCRILGYLLQDLVRDISPYVLPSQRLVIQRANEVASKVIPRFLRIRYHTPTFRCLHYIALKTELYYHV